jgi:long-chain acyl-CoA synthetase
MTGYLNKPEETKNALREHDGKIWMHTGDDGRMDDDGFVYVVDRAKDMIIVGGYKVFSSEVEDKLYKKSLRV